MVLHVVPHYAPNKGMIRSLRFDSIPIMPLKRAFLVLSLLTLASCSFVRDTQAKLGDIAETYKALSKALPKEAIYIRLMNTTTMSVRLTNSQLKSLPESQRKAKALEIARIAYQGDPSRADLREVAVIFAVHRDFLGVVNFDDARDVFRFETAQLGASS